MAQSANRHFNLSDFKLKNKPEFIRVGILTSYAPCLDGGGSAATQTNKQTNLTKRIYNGRD